MEELVRDKIHDALDVEQPDGALRSRILASLPIEQQLVHRTRAGSLKVAGGMAALILAVALGVVLYSSGAFNKQPAHVGQCQYLYSPGGAFHVLTRHVSTSFINESASPCMIRAPQISFIDSSGNKLNVPQDWVPGATQGFVILESMAVASIQYSITPDLCSEQSVQYVSIRASFGSGPDVNVPAAGGLCNGARILGLGSDRDHRLPGRLVQGGRAQQPETNLLAARSNSRPCMPFWLESRRGGRPLMPFWLVFWLHVRPFMPELRRRAPGRCAAWLHSMVACDT